jgi:pyruvate dehydrogenase E2 component (dihydrolipoamide acetyltransferase)
MSKIEAVTVPKWGMTMTEGTIVAWLVAEGDVISKGDEIVEIETTKLTNVVESAAAGTLRRIVLGEGTTAPVGALAAVVVEGEASEDEIAAFIASYAARAGAGADSDAGPTALSVEVDGAVVNYLSMGAEDGPAVVLLHGFGGDLTTWMFNQGDLAGELRCVAIDLPGHGNSAVTRNADAFEGAVAAALGVIDALGIKTVHLVGHSFGGAVAAMVARRLGTRVASVSLIAPIGLGPEMSGDFLTDFIASDRRRPLQKVLERLVADPSKITTDMVEGTLNFKRLEGVPEGLEEIAAAIADGNRQLREIAGDLAALSSPVQLIWGEDDQIVPVPADVPGNAVLKVLSGAGHMPQMEASAAVNRNLLGLIRTFG